MGSHNAKPEVANHRLTLQSPRTSNLEAGSFKSLALQGSEVFEGEEHNDGRMADLINYVIRTESVHVDNDPRVMADSVISHRLNGFNSVVIASMLLTTLAFAPLTVLKPKDMDSKGIGITILVLYLGVLVANLFCTVVVIQQAYLINRLATAGTMGFEMAKSLYLTKNFTALRHAAIWLFFMSVPMFILATALMVYERVVKPYYGMPTALVIMSFLIIIALVIHAVHHKQRAIFAEKLRQMSNYEQPMRAHMESKATWRQASNLAID